MVLEDVRHDRVGKACTTGADDLKAKALGALRRREITCELLSGSG